MIKTQTERSLKFLGENLARFKNDVYFWKNIKYFIMEHKYSQEMPNTPNNREQIVPRVCSIKEAQQKKPDNRPVYWQVTYYGGCLLQRKDMRVLFS